MYRRPGCLAPIGLVFAIGVVVVIAGVAAENPRLVKGGVLCFFITAALVVLGVILRHKGWWD